MGYSADYRDLPEWMPRAGGYKLGERVRYRGSVFEALREAAQPPGSDGTVEWALLDEMYDLTARAGAGTESRSVKVIGYLPAWRRDRFDFARPELYQGFTQVVIAFLTFEHGSDQFSKQSMSDFEAVLRIAKDKRAEGVKVTLAVGGPSDMGFVNLLAQLGKGADTSTLVRRVVGLVRDHGLDGVALDPEGWEGLGAATPVSGPHPAGRGLTVLARGLKEAMPESTLSACVPAMPRVARLLDPGVAAYLDWVGLMAYDFTGPRDDSPVGPPAALRKLSDPRNLIAEQQGSWPRRNGGDPTADPVVDNPIVSVEEALWYWTNPDYTDRFGPGAKVPRAKVVLAIPTHGYDFARGSDQDSVEPERHRPGFKRLDYGAVVAAFPVDPSGNSKVSGATKRPDFLKDVPGTYSFRRNLYYESPDAAAAKLAFMRETGGYGVVVRDIGGDTIEDVHSIVKSLLRNVAGPGVAPARDDLSPAAREAYRRLAALEEGARRGVKRTVIGHHLEAHKRMSYGTNGVPTWWTLNAAGYCWRRLGEITGWRYPRFVELDLGPGNGAPSFDDRGEFGFGYVYEGLRFAADHAKKGGIVGYSFHHPYPGSRSKDFNACFPGSEQDDEWFAGLTRPGPTNDLLRADLDWVADRLVGLRDQGIPVLFRPYHEMNKTKNPFWWANRPAADFERLWGYAYDHLVRARGLNNLLWVWSPYEWDDRQEYARDPRGYYPDGRVDIVALDAYGDPFQQARFHQSFFDYKRPRMLAETDKMPVNRAMSVTLTDAAPWVIWSVWAYTLWDDVNGENKKPNAWNAAEDYRAVRETYAERGRILALGDPWPGPP